MSNALPKPIDSALTRQRHPYPPDLQVKFEILLQEIDALLHSLEQEQVPLPCEATAVQNPPLLFCPLEMAAPAHPSGPLLALAC